MANNTLERLANDTYFTHPNITTTLLNYLPLRDQLILEPCCGDKHISKLLEKHHNTVVSTDISYGEEYDASNYKYWEGKYRYDYVVTNPPYNKEVMQNIIDFSWQHARKGIAMLLRLSYLEPVKNRANFLRDNPLHHLLIFGQPRPGFRTDTTGTDCMTTAWFVWLKKELPVGGTNIQFVTKWKAND